MNEDDAIVSALDNLINKIKNLKPYNLLEFPITHKAGIVHELPTPDGRPNIIQRAGNSISKNISVHRDIYKINQSLYELSESIIDKKYTSKEGIDNIDLLIGVLYIILRTCIISSNNISDDDKTVVEYVEENNIISKNKILILNRDSAITSAYAYKFSDAIEISLNKIEETNQKIEECDSNIHNFTELLKNEKNNVDGLINNFNKIKEENYEKLAEAFESLKGPKIKERNTAYNTTISIGILMLIATLASAFSGEILVNNIDANPNNFAQHIPFSIIIIDILLIYFFRISLRNYYTARDEYLQIEIRTALCKFVQIFSKFSDTTKGGLEEFSKHIFSPLNSKIYSTPHPIDFLATITSAAKSCTSKSEKSETDH